MNAIAITDDLFFTRAGLDRTRTEGIVEEALSGADDGELFLEYRQSEGLSFDDGRLKSASFDTTQGFGLRAIADEATGYAHASAIPASRRKGRRRRTVRFIRTPIRCPPPRSRIRSPCSKKSTPMRARSTHASTRS